MYKGTERSARLQLGLKEQVEAGRAGKSHPKGLQGLERSLYLIPSTMEPPPRKFHALFGSPTSGTWSASSRWGPRKPSVADGKDSLLWSP